MARAVGEVDTSFATSYRWIEIAKNIEIRNWKNQKKLPIVLYPDIESLRELSKTFDLAKE